MSLIELTVALALFSIILAGTLGFYRQQGRAFVYGNERSTVMQNLRYATNTLEQQLRTAGIGVPMAQPVIVYAGPDVVAFNADYASNLANDFFAVYVDVRYPAQAVSALTHSRRITIPRTTFQYPDTSYFAGSGNSPAETIIFFFAPDSAMGHPDTYALYRQVNDLPPEVVARHLLATEQPFFSYYTVNEVTTGSPIQRIADTRLPKAHTEAIHGSPADTGAVALTDSIRAIEVSFAATDARDGANGVRREIRRLIRLPNTGMGAPRSCGNRPILGTSLTGNTIQPTGSTAGRVRLTWNPAVDEVSGERDVIRYVLWRRSSTSAPWGDPLVSVAAGMATYVYEDYSAEPGVAYYYALAAQDCTPQFSDQALFGPSTPLSTPP
jgi:type II secretory pathway pseudopilin PulG